MPRTPPASTWMPASRAGCAAAMTSLASSRVTSPPFTSMSTWAMAVFSSSLTSSDAGAARERAGHAGDVRRRLHAPHGLLDGAPAPPGRAACPCAAWKTTGLWPFCCGANSLARKSVAACVSVPGRRMSLEVRAPSTTQPVADHGDDARPHQQHDPRAPHAAGRRVCREGWTRSGYPSCGRDSDDTYPVPSVNRRDDAAPAGGAGKGDSVKKRLKITKRGGGDARRARPRRGPRRLRRARAARARRPSTIYPESSPTGTLPALKAYLDRRPGRPRPGQHDGRRAAGRGRRA